MRVSSGSSACTAGVRTDSRQPRISINANKCFFIFFLPVSSPIPAQPDGLQMETGVL